MNLSSESDSMICTGSLDSSDTYQLQELNNKLRERNEKLMNQVSSMQAHFDQATSITSQLEKLHAQNAKLASDLRKVTAERDDLSHRLDINIQMLEEFKASAETEKRELEQNSHAELADVQASFAREREQYDDLLSKCKKDAKELTAQIQSAKGEKDAIARQLEDVLAAARSHFLMNFKTADQLISHLEQPKKPEIVEKLVKDEDAINEALKKAHCMKKKAREARKAKDMADAEIAQMKQELERAKEETQKLADAYESKLASTQTQARVADAEHKEDIAMKDAEIAELKSKVEKATAKVASCENQMEEVKRESQKPEAEARSLKAKNDDLLGQVKEMKASILALRKQNAALTSQLSDAGNEADALKRKQQRTEEELEHTRSNLAEAKNTICSTILERDDMKEKYETAVSQIKAAKTSFKQSQAAFNDSENKARKAEKSLAIMEDALAKQKQEMESLADEKAKLVELVDKQGNALQEMEKCCAQLTDKCKKQSRYMKDQQHDMERLREEKNKPEEIPVTCWYSPDFPKDLCTLINDIAQNTSLPTPSKLKHVLATIAKFYENKVKKMNEDIVAAEDETAATATALDKLLIHIGQIVGNQNLAAETYLKDPKEPHGVACALQGMKHELIDSKIENTQLRDNMEKFFEMMNAKCYGDSMSALSNLFREFENAKKQIEAMQQKDKKQKKVIHVMKATAEQESRDRMNAEEAFKGQIAALRSEKKSLLAELAATNTEKEACEQKIHNMEVDFCAKVDQMTNEQQEALSNLQSKMDHGDSVHKEQLIEKDMEINKLKGHIQKLDCEIAQWKRALELIKTAKAETEAKLEETIAENEERAKIADNRANQKLEDVKQQYESAMTQIKAKNNELRALVTNVSEALDESECRNRELAAENNELLNDKRDLTSQLEQSCEEHKRDKQILDARIRAIELSEKTQRQIDMEELSSKFDDEKRKIHATVANSFPTLFDPRKQLNDETFRGLISSASAELKRYQKQDVAIRRLLGLTSEESCEAAVSHMLLSMYNCNTK